MNRIELVRHQGFPWFFQDGCHVKGYAYDPDNRLLNEEKLAQYLLDAVDFNHFQSKVAECNGLFSVVLERNGACWLACDPIRTFPLFYRMKEAGVLISDSTDHLLKMFAAVAGSPETGPSSKSSPVQSTLAQNKSVQSTPMQGRPEDQRAILPLADLHVQEFLSAGFVSGQGTLLQDVLQVQAGEVLCLEGSKAARQFYHTYQASRLKEYSERVLLDQLDKVSQAVFDRLAKSLRGRTVVIALSGGYDSRFIAAMLRQRSCDRVICYTYGREGNADMAAATLVAEQLGFPLVRIPYTGEMIRNFHLDPAFPDYVRFSANHTSMFFLQEYFAVKYLRERKLVPEDAVFVPGHSGDFLGGGLYIRHGLKPGRESIDKTLSRIYRIKYIYDRPKGRTRADLLQKIRQTLEEKAIVKGAWPFTIHEDWDLKEKLSKFIVNSCSVYAWFGYAYRLPFYDLAFLDFFQNLPFAMKSGKYLYDKYLKEGPFQQFGINLEPEIQPGLRTHYLVRWKSRLKKWIPSALLPSKPPDNDPIFYKEITRVLQQEMSGKGIRLPVRNRSYNSLLIQWYIESLKHGWI